MLRNSSGDLSRFKVSHTILRPMLIVNYSEASFGLPDCMHLLCMFLNPCFDFIYIVDGESDFLCNKCQRTCIFAITARN